MGALCCTCNSDATSNSDDYEQRLPSRNSREESPEQVSSIGGKFVTSAELANHLGESRPNGKVMINLDKIETILLHADEGGELKRTVERQSTGFVTQKHLEAASNKVSFADVGKSANGEAEGTRRVQGRKGTGAVTKERLLEVLEDLSDEEAEVEQVKDVPLNKTPAAVANRVKARKGTGFVSREKLHKLVDSGGEQEEHE